MYKNNYSKYQPSYITGVEMAAIGVLGGILGVKIAEAFSGGGHHAKEGHASHMSLENRI